MGVSYDPKYGIKQIHYSCGAEKGDYVQVSGDSYVVVAIDDYGCFVCENLNPNCLYENEFRTFDDVDIDKVVKAKDTYGHGEGI